MMTMKQGDRVRWYVATLGDFNNAHTPHWHGNTVLVAGQRTDVLALTSAQMITVARDGAFDDLLDLAMQQWLATGDHHHRGAALVDRFHAFGDGQALVQNFRWIVDLAAAGTGQIAAEQWLQHQYQRVALDVESGAA